MMEALRPTVLGHFDLVRIFRPDHTFSASLPILHSYYEVVRVAREVIGEKYKKNLRRRLIFTGDESEKGVIGVESSASSRWPPARR